MIASKDALRVTIFRSFMAILAVSTLRASTTNGADLLAYDGFDYTAESTMIGKGGNQPWPATTYWESVTNFPTPTDAHVDGYGLYFPGLATTGYSLETNTKDNGVRRSIGATYATAGNIHWFSALMRIEDNPSVAYGGISLFDGAPGSSGSEKLFFGQRNNSPYWGIERSGGASNSSTISTAGATTHLLVVKLDGVAGTASLYVDPASLGGAPPASPSAQIAVGTNFNFNYFRIQSGGTTLGGNLMLDADELRFGTTYASVTPVPEPTTWVLGLASICTLLGAGRIAARNSARRYLLTATVPPDSVVI